MLALVMSADSDPLSGARVVVLGLARQGRALGRWLPTVGAHVTLSDSRSADLLGDTVDEFAGHPAITLALGGHPLDLLEGCDLLCVSGGVPLTLPIVQEAFRRGVRVANDAQLFLERCPAPVLGITGSAGKTTTTALAGAMCAHWTETTGHQTFVGGNIGDVLLDVLDDIQPDDRVVMELSSFQLELVTTSPPVGVVLNLTPNHLDRHLTIDAYRAAKTHIYAHQSPDQVAIFGWDDPEARAMSRETPGQVAYFSRQEPVTSGAYRAGDDLLVVGHSSPDGGPVVVASRDAISLRGQHNMLNTLAACAAAGVGGVPVVSMRAALATFEGVAHRLEAVAMIDGVLWVNDSIATAPERVSAALASYNEPLVLLAGGRDKDLPWDDLAARAVTACRAVIAFGEYGPQVAAHMQQALAQTPGAMLEHVAVVPDIPAAVQAAQQVARAGDVVLLSPGGTSFDAYPDFAARGQHFRELVHALHGEE